MFKLIIGFILGFIVSASVAFAVYTPRIPPDNEVDCWSGCMEQCYGDEWDYN